MGVCGSSGSASDSNEGENRRESDTPRVSSVGESEPKPKRSEPKPKQSEPKPDPQEPQEPSTSQEEQDERDEPAPQPIVESESLAKSEAKESQPYVEYVEGIGGQQNVQDSINQEMRQQLDRLNSGFYTELVDAAARCQTTLEFLEFCKRTKECELLDEDEIESLDVQFTPSDMREKAIKILDCPPGESIDQQDIQDMIEEFRGISERVLELVSQKDIKLKHLTEFEVKIWWIASFEMEKVVLADKMTEAFGKYFPDAPRCTEHISKYVIDNGVEGVVTLEQFSNFLKRFGPFETCLNKCAQSLFPEGVLVPWFHGDITREKSDTLLTDYGAGGYLVRYSGSTPDALIISYHREKDGKKGVKNLFVHNHRGGYCLSKHPNVKHPLMSSISEVIESHSRIMMYPVESALFGLAMRKIGTQGGLYERFD